MNELVAAIDFGTTYSGYAFSLLSDYKENPLKITIYYKWIGNVSKTSVKNASCILLDQDQKLIAFGSEAENRYNDLVEDSKEDDTDDKIYES
ncbi:Heat shock 70 kDa protein 12B [Mizuhopecten yessoensis]|uniref:Heat shock 70 kDa protein 12B n=1 Tax=Mizuhopecten yessoensis TaxID=6573 RepID=A0A210Q982_MIZYE|nr:Heat shock 70 kDa protein 12B [Mizuhopecten yessoensis]